MVLETPPCSPVTPSVDRGHGGIHLRPDRGWLVIDTRPAPAPIRIAHITTIDLSLAALLLPQLKALCAAGYEVTGISAPGRHVAHLEANGIRHLPWRSATRSWRPLHDVRAFLELIRMLRRERFDVVHTHNPKPGILGRIAARLAGTRCIVNTVHGFYIRPDQGRVKRNLVLSIEKFAARFSDSELYQSEEDLQLAIETELASPAKLRYLGNGVDVSFFAPDQVSPEQRNATRSSLGIDPEAHVVGAVGRLVAEKGYRELFRAFEKVRTKDPSAILLIVGDRDVDKTDALTASELDRLEGVVLTGWRDDVRELLAAMDVFVLASWREGVPRAMLEAAAMGTAIVATDIRGSREVVRDGIEGMLVPVRSEDALATAIAKLLREESLRSKLGSAARARVVERFNENSVIEILFDTYEDLLRRRGLVPVAGNGEITIRRARPMDARATSSIHSATLPDAFLPSLGPRFLRLLHRALIAHPDAVVLVAVRGEKVVGFCAGVRSVKDFYKAFALRHGLAAAKRMFPRILAPQVLRGVAETIRYPNLASASDAELLVIGVVPEETGSGIGKRLVAPLASAMSELGVGSMQVVVAAANEGANRFYAGVGFEPAGELSVHGTVPSNVWVMRCQSPSVS